MVWAFRLGRGGRGGDGIRTSPGMDLCDKSRPPQNVASKFPLQTSASELFMSVVAYAYINSGDVRIHKCSVALLRRRFLTAKTQSHSCYVSSLKCVAPKAGRAIETGLRACN